MTKPNSTNASEMFVPLDKLKKSPKNVRKVPHSTADIEALAASIAANGLLQNLVVEPEADNKGRKTGYFLVTIGEGRRLALAQLAKQKAISKNHPVRCVLDIAHNATEISLAENVVRTAMHPADEYEAFAELHNVKGMAADDIAARFGVTPAVVKQRLKLGAVSPRLMAVYRESGMSLEQLMAFTLTDDHERQEQVWQNLDWQNDGRAIKRALTEGQVHGSDRRARFVGQEVYAAEGGIIVRDLFDEASSGYFTDVALLERLVLAKLEQSAQDVRAEGWSWVLVVPEFDYQQASGMRRVYAHEPTLSAKAQKQYDKLSEQHDALVDLCESGEATEKEEAEIVELGQKMDALRGPDVYAPEDIASGGAFVSLGYDGELRIERGFIRKEDEAPKAVQPEPEGREGAETEKPTALSDKLVANLSAYRTAALREAVAARPEVAFLAAVHALVLRTFYSYSSGQSCLDIAPRSAPLTPHVPGFDETPLGRAHAERHGKLAALLPKEAEELWDALAVTSSAELMVYLAHCAANTIDTVVTKGSHRSGELKHAQKLSEAVSLDMRTCWQPTADSYLSHVTKPLIMDAVREGVSSDAAARLADMKKGDMAKAAEQLLVGKGWLPPLLRQAAA